MLITETITINGTEYLHNYSDANKYIERDGIKYSDAVDPLDSGRVYTETDEEMPVATQPELEEERAVAD